MSFVNHERRHIYIHVPKTAGTSMENLHWVGGSSHATIYELIGKGEDYFKWGFIRNPIGRFVSAYNSCKSRFGPNSYFKQVLGSRDLTMEECIRYLENQMIGKPDNLTLDEDGFKSLFPKSDAKSKITTFPFLHFIPQHMLLCIDGKISVDFVGRFENLQADFQKVSTRILGSPHGLPRTNVGPSNRSISSEFQNRLRKIYSTDFEMWYS